MNELAISTAILLAERLSLALWIGGTFVLWGLVGPVLNKRLPSRGLASDVRAELGARFDIVRYVLASVLVLILFVRVEMGEGGTAMVVRASLVSCLAAIAIYSGMVLAVKKAYYRSKIENIDEVAEDDPWLARVGQMEKRASRLSLLSLVLAIALAGVP